MTISISSFNLSKICEMTGLFSNGNKALCKPEILSFLLPIPAASIHNFFN